MSYKSPNKSPSQFIQLSLDFSGSFPDSFTLDSSLLYESPESSPLSVSMEPAESSLALSERSSRFGERERGKGAITFLCIGHGNGFRRYISSDGYPWTLWLKTLRLERGYANIHISPSERLYSDKRPPYVRFNYNGGCHLAHRLVAQFFLNGGEPIPPGMEVDHLDGNRLNNAVSNLEIVTTAENIRRRNVKHGWKHQTAHQRKLKNENNRRRMARLRAQRAAQSSPSPSSPSSVVPNGTPSSPAL